MLDYLDEASAAKSIDKLWDCILVLRPLVSRSRVYSSSGAIYVREPKLPEAYLRAVELLADLGDHNALELATAELVGQRHLQIVMAHKYNRPLPPLPAAELQQLTRLVDLSYQYGLEPTLLSCALLSAELHAVGKRDEGEQLLQKSLSAATSSSQVSGVGQEFYRINLAIAQEIALRAFQLELASESVDANVVKSLIVIYEAAQREPSSLANFGKFVNDLIRVQADHLRSVPAAEFAFDRESVLPYTSVQSAEEHRVSSADFPLPSPFVSNSLLTLLRYLRINGNEDVWQAVPGWLAQPKVVARTNSNIDPAAERADLAVRLICGCYWQWWFEESSSAIALLRQAKTHVDALQLLELNEAHMLIRSSSRC